MSETRKLAQGFPPSEYIKEEMEERGWSIETLAEKTMLGRAYLEPILNDKRRITKGSALMLGKAFDTGPEVWENLQAGWDEWKANGYITIR